MSFRLLATIIAVALCPFAATASPLVGIDFGPAGSAPTNWNLVSATGIFSNLIDQTGTTTSVSLTLTVPGGTATPYAVTPVASTVPIASPSLAGIDGNVYSFAPFNTLNATLGGLVPGGQYAIWVFGLRGGNTLSQTVTVTGLGSPLVYTQSAADSQLVVNQELGSDTRTLESYADTVFATLSGTISVQVVGDIYASPFTVAGMAIQAVPEIDLSGTGSALVLVSGAIGLLERRRRKPE